MKLYKLELNLQQGLIHTGRENICNAVCAIFDHHKRVIVIRPEYIEIENRIINMINFEYEVTYGNAFHVDTWDEKIKLRAYIS